MMISNTKEYYHSLLIALVCSLFLLAPMLISSVSAQSEPEEVIFASTAIPSPLAKNIVLVEQFIEDTPNADDPQQQDLWRKYQARDDVLPLSWWKWSDETGSDWPDDDAKARAGQLGMQQQSQQQAQYVLNSNIEQFQDIDEAIQRASDFSVQEVVIELSGDIILTTNQQGEYEVKIQAEFEPMVNLSDDTMLYIFLSEDNAEDVHGRQIKNLIRDMKPEVGFSVEANNITNTTWIMPKEHLIAAGIDLEENPLGWHLTLAFIGSVEGDDEATGLLALYNSPLPNQWSNPQSSKFLMPIILIIFTTAIAFIVYSNASIREKGMPKINVGWKKTSGPAIMVSIEAGNQKVSVTKLEIEQPWKSRGGFKQLEIKENSKYDLNISFKQGHPEDLSFSLTMVIEELGGWTQHLRLSPPQQEQENQLQSVEGNEE
ncbi:MAG: hypothetical protein OSB30_02685 [Candidatus Poseidoniaceae archaeon]|nr:hypothetical protein [Candidatus Poseidoniaceae archaeon]